MENVKDWLDKRGYYNSGLRTDRNHRIDLYLSDVLEEYRTELLNIHNVVGQSEQLSLCSCEKHSPDIMYGKTCVECCLEINPKA